MRIFHKSKGQEKNVTGGGRKAVTETRVPRFWFS
jgi:hypothetical protein